MILEFLPSSSTNLVSQITIETDVSRHIIFSPFPGVEGVQVEEIYSLDEEQFRELKPVYGLIFLFKWVHDENPQGSLVQDARVQDMFFAKQVS